MGDKQYFDRLKALMDEYVHLIYRLTKKFPKDEIYGTTSQLRRATLSVILNFIEGYARMRPAVRLNFWEISYGSLQESKYLVGFSYKEEYITAAEHEQALKLANEIGAMFWPAIQTLTKTAH